MSTQTTAFTASDLPKNGEFIEDYNVNTTLNALINDYNLKIGLDKIDTTVLSAIYPVGSVYINASVSTNPSVLLGFGTWASVGDGMVMVNYKAGDSDFGTLGATGGEKTHALSTAELASHNHSVTDPGHGHAIHQDGNGALNPLYIHPAIAMTSGGFNPAGADPFGLAFRADNTTTGVTTNTNGSGTAHNNLQPFVVCYIWKRTA